MPRGGVCGGLCVCFSQPAAVLGAGLGWEAGLTPRFAALVFPRDERNTEWAWEGDDPEERLRRSITHVSVPGDVPSVFLVRVCGGHSLGQSAASCQRGGLSLGG